MVPAGARLKPANTKLRVYGSFQLQDGADDPDHDHGNRSEAK
jgi:hypothetical protein